MLCKRPCVICGVSVFYSFAQTLDHQMHLVGMMLLQGVVVCENHSFYNTVFVSTLSHAQAIDTLNSDGTVNLVHRVTYLLFVYLG